MAYIDAEAFKRKLIDEKSFFPAIVARALEEMTPADVVEVKHGYWEEIKCGDGIFDYCFKCSNCGKTTPPKAFPIAPDYCPNCPAKMDGGKAE